METMTQTAWMALASERSPCLNDSALARRMKVTQSSWATWKSGTRPLPQERILQICEIADMDVDTAMLLRAIWTAKPAAKPVYERIFQTFARVALLVPLAVFFTWSAPSPAQAFQNEINSLTPQTSFLNNYHYARKRGTVARYLHHVACIITRAAHSARFKRASP